MVVVQGCLVVILLGYAANCTHEYLTLSATAVFRAYFEFPEGAMKVKRSRGSCILSVAVRAEPAALSLNYGNSPDPCLAP